MTSRDVARKVLARVEGGAFANLALSAELSRARLRDDDAALCTELVYGVLKRRLRLDRALAALTPRGLGGVDPRTLDALRLAALQILFLRVPAHAAVDDAVGAVKRARGDRVGGFVNAVLRRLATAGEPPLPDERDLAAFLEAAESAPRWLVDDARARLGDDGARALLHAWNEPAPAWLRANPSRTTREALAEELARERPRARIAPPEGPLAALAKDALAVHRGGDLSTTAAFGAGRCTVQDLGAQLCGLLLDPQPGERLLDACSGVGGKSTHLAALTGGRAHIDAADLSERKLELLRDTAHRLGLAGIHPLVADLTDEGAPLADAYDRVLLDAPCSGLGVLRRHPELKWRRLRDEVKALATLQSKLLGALAGRVRPGGLLVYSVCTFTDEEGPRQVAAFLAAHPDFTVEPPPPAYASLAAPADRPGEAGAIRTWPHRDDADAFFAVRLRRRG